MLFVPIGEAKHQLDCQPLPANLVLKPNWSEVSDPLDVIEESQMCAVLYAEEG